MSAFDLRPLRVAIDLESVLASTHPYFINTYNDLYGTNHTTKDIDNWDWVRETVDWKVFDGIVHGGWKNHPEKIKRQEEDAPEAFNRFANHEDIIVNIVTARTGVKSEMERWLKTNGFTDHDGFLTTEMSKPKLGYDIYVDDNPTMPPKLKDNQLQYLIKGSHNRGVDSHDNVIELYRITTAIKDILTKYTKKENINISQQQS